MKVILHDDNSLSLTQEVNSVVEDVLGDTSYYGISANGYISSIRGTGFGSTWTGSVTIELNLGQVDTQKGRVFLGGVDAVDEFYKLGFILKSFEKLRSHIVRMQSLVLRNVHIDALLTSDVKQATIDAARPEIERLVQEGKNADAQAAGSSAESKKTGDDEEGAPLDIFKYQDKPGDEKRQQAKYIEKKLQTLTTLEEFLAELDGFGVQSLELHCKDVAHYEELNRRLGAYQLSGKLYVVACLDDVNGVVTEQTIWPQKKVSMQQWQPVHVGVSASTSMSAPRKVVEHYKEDATPRTGHTKAELEVAVNVEAQVEVTKQVQAQREITIETHVDKQLQQQYQSNLNLNGPAVEDRGIIGHSDAYRLDELLGIPVSVTERANNQEALTVGTYDTWDPGMLTREPRAKAAMLYAGSNRYDDGERNPTNRKIYKVKQINRAIHVLVASIFEEYCRSLPENERSFDALQARCKAGESFDLMEEIKNVRSLSNPTLSKQAYSYVARQYVRFISGLTGAASVHVEVLGNDDEITGISWQTLMQQYTAKGGLNSWHIDDSILMLACHNYQLFKGGIDYNNLPLGTRVYKCKVPYYIYKATPTEHADQRRHDHIARNGSWSNKDDIVYSIAWRSDHYKEDKENNQNKLRIDPLANTTHQDPFKQQSLAMHYRAQNADVASSAREELPKDPGRPDVISKAGLIAGDDPLDQYINYYRGLQQNLPPQPLVDVLYDKLPDTYKNDSVRAVIEDMCGTEKINYNILSIVAVYGIDALAGIATHLLAIRELNKGTPDNKTYRALIHCIRYNTSRPDWSYLATKEMLDKLKWLASNLEVLKREYVQPKEGDPTTSATTDEVSPLEARKLKVKLQFLEAVLNSASGPAIDGEARSSHTGNTDLDTTIKAFEYFWERVQAMTGDIPGNQNNEFVAELQEELVRRVTGSSAKGRCIILDGVSGNTQTDLYRLYRILDHAASKSPEMLMQQIVALNAEPEYKAALEAAGPNANTIEEHLKFVNARVAAVQLNSYHSLKCSLAQHSAVYAMDLAKTCEGSEEYKQTAFLHDIWDPIIITPEMSLASGAAIGRYTGPHNVARPEIGELTYYNTYDKYADSANRSLLYTGAHWRALYAREPNSNDDKVTAPKDIEWSRRQYYRILTEFQPEYADEVLQFFSDYLRQFQLILKYDSASIREQDKTAVQAEFERLIDTLKEYTARLSVKLANAQIGLSGSGVAMVLYESDMDDAKKHKTSGTYFMGRLQEELLHTRYRVKLDNKYIDARHAASRCRAIWFAAHRCDSSIPPLLTDFSHDISGFRYPDNAFWNNQVVEPTGADMLLYDRYKNEDLLTLCILCTNSSLPKDPREWKKDLSIHDATVSPADILKNSAALRTIKYVNEWLDEIDWENVVNFHQVDYQELCKALKGKTTSEACRKEMDRLFPNLIRKADLILDQISWDELLANKQPAVTIVGKGYAQWKQEQSPEVIGKLTGKQGIRSMVSDAFVTTSEWGADDQEKKRISALVLHHYLLHFLPRQVVRNHETGRADRLDSKATRYVDDMLEALTGGDAYQFIGDNSVDEIDAQIRAKLATLVRLQPMGMQHHMRSIELIRSSYDTDMEHAQGIEFLLQILGAMKIKQPFKHPRREQTPDNLMRTMAYNADLWATPSEVSGSGRNRVQRYNHDLYKNDLRLFLSTVMKFATFAQEIKGFNFSELTQAALNLYQLRDVRRYDKSVTADSNSSSSSSVIAAKREIAHIPLQLFEVLERVCRQQDKMLLMKYIAAFSPAKDASKAQQSSMGSSLECVMNLLKTAPDLVMNLVFALDRRLGKNQQKPAPQVFVDLISSISQKNPAVHVHLIRIADQILRNKFANPDKSEGAPALQRLQMSDINLLNTFIARIAGLDNDTLTALERLVTKPICHSIDLKRDLLERQELSKEYCEEKSKAFFQDAGRNLVFGWSKNKNADARMQEDMLKLREKLAQVQVKKPGDTQWQQLDNNTINALANGWSEAILKVQNGLISYTDKQFADGLKETVELYKQDPSNLANLLAYIAVGRYRTTGEFPRPIQLVSVLYSKTRAKGEQNIFHGMKTGSGKTIAIAINDAVDALLGAKLIISTSTYDLASRDAVSQRKFHAYLGLQSNNTPITPLATTMEDFKQYNIHYGTLPDIILWRMKQQSENASFKDMRIRLKADEMDRDAHSPIKQRLAKRQELSNGGEAGKSAAVWQRLLELIVEMVDTEKSEQNLWQLLYEPYSRDPQQGFTAEDNHHNLLVFLEHKKEKLSAEVEAAVDPRDKIKLEDDLALVKRAKGMLCPKADSRPEKELENAAKGLLDRDTIHSLVEAAVDSKAALAHWKQGVDYYDVPEYNWNDLGRSPVMSAQHRKVSIVDGIFSKASRSIVYGRSMQQFLHLRANAQEQAQPGAQPRHFVIDDLSDTIAMSSSQEELLGVQSIEELAALEDFGFETCEGYSATMGNEHDQQEFIANQKFTLIKYPTHEEWESKELFADLDVEAHRDADPKNKNGHVLIVDDLDAQVDALIQTAIEINKPTIALTKQAQPLNLLCETEAEVRALYAKLAEKLRDNPQLRTLFPALQTYTKGMVHELKDGRLYSYDYENYKKAREALGLEKNTNKQKDLHAKVVKQMSHLGVITIGTIGTMARGVDAKSIPILNDTGQQLQDPVTRAPMTTNLTTIVLSSKSITRPAATQSLGRTHGRFKGGRAGFILIGSDVANSLNEHEEQKVQKRHYDENNISVPDVVDLAARNAAKNRQAREASRLPDRVWRYLQYETFRLIGAVRELADKAAERQEGGSGKPINYSQALDLLPFVTRLLHVKLSRYFQDNPDATNEQFVQYAAGEWARLVNQAPGIPLRPEIRIDGIKERLDRHLAARHVVQPVLPESKSIPQKKDSTFIKAITAPYYAIDVASNAIFMSTASVITKSKATQKRVAMVGNRTFFMLLMSSTMMFVPSLVTGVLEQANVTDLAVKALPSPLSHYVLGAFEYQTMLVYMGIGMIVGATFGGLLQSSSRDKQQIALRQFGESHSALFSGVTSGAISGLLYAAQRYSLQYATEILLTKYATSTILSSPEATLAILLATHLISGILSTIEYSFLNETINKHMSAGVGENTASLIEG
ncbi:MAG: hypothetical protein JSS50_01685 [Proteobacteria bacterium]|nr:hypothetical protein [Pseudomonadota bacterium]